MSLVYSARPHGNLFFGFVGTAAQPFQALLKASTHLCGDAKFGMRMRGTKEEGRATKIKERNNVRCFRSDESCMLG
jgi:hypothetical protein